MEKLSRFLEFGSIDNKLYWRIPGLEAQEMYEVQWRKDHPIAWRYRKLGEIFWKLSKGNEVASALEKEGIDVHDLESKVRYSVLQQVAFASRIVEDARKQFGKELVDQAISENHEFMNQLEEAVLRLTNQEPNESKRPSLKIVKSD